MDCHARQGEDLHRKADQHGRPQRMHRLRRPDRVRAQAENGARHPQPFQGAGEQVAGGIRGGAGQEDGRALARLDHLAHAQVKKGQGPLQVRLGEPQPLGRTGGAGAVQADDPRHRILADADHVRAVGAQFGPGGQRQRGQVLQATDSGRAFGQLAPVKGGALPAVADQPAQLRPLPGVDGRAGERPRGAAHGPADQLIKRRGFHGRVTPRYSALPSLEVRL